MEKNIKVSVPLRGLVFRTSVGAKWEEVEPYVSVPLRGLVFRTGRR